MFAEEPIPNQEDNANNSTVDIQEIPLTAITALRDKLRALDKKWADKLAELMQVDVTKIYNIIHNKVQGNEWRVDFVLKGNELLTTLQSKQTSAMRLVQNQQ